MVWNEACVLAGRLNDEQIGDGKRQKHYETAPQTLRQSSVDRQFTDC